MSFNGTTKKASAIKFEDWPEIDRQAWQAACSPGAGLFGTGSPALAWSKNSIDLYLRCYGLWLTWLDEQGLLNPDQRPEERMSRERLIAYMRAQFALGTTARTLENHVAALRHMLRVLAPDTDSSWMLPIIRQLKAAVRPRKVFSDLPSIGEIFWLGMALMERAEAGGSWSEKERAVCYRNGLSIAVLAARPVMRRENMARIVIGKHLTRDDDVFRLRFASDEMKGRRTLGGPLPIALTAPIERYLDLHRPVLLSGKGDAHRALWISALGNPIYPHAMSHEIGKVTDAFFGRRITMHDFRHAAGSSVAKEDPDHVGIVPTLLGHGEFRTSERYYIHASEHAAFKRLDEAIERLRGPR